MTLADEATANVDPENEKELVEAIGELTHDKTVIMIAHRLKTVQGGRWSNRCPIGTKRPEWDRQQAEKCDILKKRCGKPQFLLLKG